MPSIPPLTDDQIKAEESFNQALTDDGLRARNNWLYDQATTGSGVAPTAVAMTAMMASHSHNGDEAEGTVIPTAGIASNNADYPGAVNLPSMIAVNAVDQPKVHDTTMTAANIKDKNVTSDKIHRTLGTPANGTWSYNIEGDPVDVGPTAGDDFPGQSFVVTNPLSPKRPCLVLPGNAPIDLGGEWFFRRFTAGNDIVIGLCGIAPFRHGPASDASYWIVCQ